ncbi:glutamate ABC transporter substrate-binding protein [Pararhizobium mangrovi]|uniref:Glutamate ABC transporter substrate-binding protein n=1 Tax=Pararhizobium mangrovi TaxID=2590452 RepID=A0A506TXS4_9HYPH|nr:glutamate ABC transporter substrate-binding protein [Pararhizobium mangrovi]TPW25988.1 glutamate ABC transporter substrate-binding protein [Pararhizobium mangrovi]
MTRSRHLKTAFLAGLVAATASSSVLAASSPFGDSSKWRDELLKEAPVANPADIPKNSTLWDAHQAGTLTYGGSKTQKLFSLQNPITGQLEGFDATMALLLAKYLTGKPSVNEKIVTSETREALLNNKTVQAVFYTYSITPERDKKVDFAGPYLVAGQSIAVRTDTNDIHDLADLKKRHVCVTKGGTAYLTMTKRVPSASLITLESSSECEQALRDGRVDAEVQDRPVLLGQVAKGGIKVVGKTITYEPYGIGLPNSSPQSVKFVNNWLKLIIKDGIWQKAIDHTLGQVEKAKIAPPVPGKNMMPKLGLN